MHHTSPLTRLEQTDLPLSRGGRLGWTATRAQPTPHPRSPDGRNAGWRHLDSFDPAGHARIPRSTPWFTAWDLAFHTIPWGPPRPGASPSTSCWSCSGSGSGLARPAYEWSFDDVDPPVRALAPRRVFLIDGPPGPATSSAASSTSCCSSFTWWLDRINPDGNNLFGGTNSAWTTSRRSIGRTFPEGFRLDQGEDAAWMAYFTAGHAHPSGDPGGARRRG